MMEMTTETTAMTHDELVETLFRKPRRERMETSTTGPDTEITEIETNRALNVFAERWTMLPFAVQDAIGETHTIALAGARYAVWTSNARCTYAMSQSKRAAIIALAAAIEQAAQDL